MPVVGIPASKRCHSEVKAGPIVIVRGAETAAAVREVRDCGPCKFFLAEGRAGHPKFKPQDPSGSGCPPGERGPEGEAPGPPGGVMPGSQAQTRPPPDHLSAEPFS